MKRLNTITLAGFAVCGFLLAMKALDLVEAGITLLLMAWGGYAYGAAAARAPLVLWAVLCTAGRACIQPVRAAPREPAIQAEQPLWPHRPHPRPHP